MASTISKTISLYFLHLTLSRRKIVSLNNPLRLLIWSRFELTPLSHEQNPWFLLKFISIIFWTVVLILSSLTLAYAKLPLGRCLNSESYIIQALPSSWCFPRESEFILGLKDFFFSCRLSIIELSVTSFTDILEDFPDYSFLTNFFYSCLLLLRYSLTSWLLLLVI